MKARLLGLALLGIAVGGLASVLAGAGGASLVALLLALLAVPSAVVGLPLLVFGPRLFPGRHIKR